MTQRLTTKSAYEQSDKYTDSGLVKCTVVPALASGRSPLIPWNVLSDKNVSTWPLEGSEPGDGHMYVTKFQ